ncbi:MAG: hypothetical protein AB200_01065 [Parcubacteria bacterium C7867-005]|nr:MAG: hypothetical protein AB200_01065 [Parcubacteria bacterium C7867-005]
MAELTLQTIQLFGLILAAFMNPDMSVDQKLEVYNQTMPALEQELNQAGGDYSKLNVDRPVELEPMMDTSVWTNLLDQ